MITSLHVAGFKSWRDSGELPLRRLTGFFGTNSSGKTSLLQLLLVLKQTSESSDRSQVLHLGDDRTLVGLGSLKDVLHRHDEDGTLSLDISWRAGRGATVVDTKGKSRSAAGDQMAFTTKVVSSGRNGAGAVESMAYTHLDETYEYRSVDSPPKSKYLLLKDGDEGFFLRNRGRPREALPPPVRCYGFPDEIRAAFQNAGFLADLELEFERLMQRITYLGPLRVYPKRQYTWAGGQPDDMGPQGQRWVDAILASRAEGKKKHWKYRTLEGLVAWWLKELGLIDSFRFKQLSPDSNLYRVLVKTTPSASEVAITDVGFGVSQILPVIVLCYYAPKGSTILLEQPEIHLHPSVQAGLADVLIDASKRRDVQIVVESHSEHLLRRLQRRVAEAESITNDDVALYFCRRHGGESRAEQLQLNLFGHIENWPEDFFGDQMEDVAEMTLAATRRKRSGERA